MTWQHPLVLALTPALLLGVWWLFRRRTAADDPSRYPAIARRWTDRHGVHPAPARGARAPRGLLLAAAALLALAALARPQWGEVAEPRVQRAREVMLALDLSRSMLAEDVAPTRLARAKLLIEAMLDTLRGERIGLTVFAGTAFVQSPLSADYEVLRELLAGLDPDALPQGGSNYAAMLRAATDGFGPPGDGDRYLVVLGDGEAHDEAWRARLPDLRARGIRVVALGIGTPAGAPVPAAGGGVTRDAQGNAVLSRLAPATLQALAAETDGIYREAATWVDLAELVGATVAQGRQGDYVERQHVRLADQFQWFLAPALLLFLLSYWRELPVLPLARAHQTRGRRSPRAAAPALATALAGLVAWHALGQAPAAAADPPPPPGPAAAVDPPDLTATVASLSAQRALAAPDYARLATDTVAYAAHPTAPRGPERAGVIDDALAAVALGEQADAQAADWPALRSALEALRDPPPPPQDESPPPSDQPCDNPSGDGSSDGSSDEQDGQASSDDGAESAPDGAAGDPSAAAAAAGDPAGDSGESAPPEASDQADAGAADGSSAGTPGEEASPDDAQHASAADAPAADAGAAAGSEDTPAGAPTGAGETPPAHAGDLEPRPLDAPGLDDDGTPERNEHAPTRLIGGGAALADATEDRAEAEALGDGALADVIGRMRAVQQGDAPAVLFERMDRADGQPRAPQFTQDW